MHSTNSPDVVPRARVRPRVRRFHRQKPGPRIRQGLRRWDPPPTPCGPLSGALPSLCVPAAPSPRFGGSGHGRHSLKTGTAGRLPECGFVVALRCGPLRLEEARGLRAQGRAESSATGSPHLRLFRLFAYLWRCRKHRLCLGTTRLSVVAGSLCCGVGGCARLLRASPTCISFRFPAPAGAGAWGVRPGRRPGCRSCLPGRSVGCEWVRS